MMMFPALWSSCMHRPGEGGHTWICPGWLSPLKSQRLAWLENIPTVFPTPKLLEKVKLLSTQKVRWVAADAVSAPITAVAAAIALAAATAITRLAFMKEPFG